MRISRSYELRMDGVMEGGIRGRGVTSIDVRGEDISVVVALQPAQNIPGRVLASDPSRIASLSALTVLLGTRSASVGSDGAFVVPEVLDGFYPVTVDGLPPEAYIADGLYGGNSLHGTARTLNGPELQAGPFPDLKAWGARNGQISRSQKFFKAVNGALRKATSP